VRFRSQDANTLKTIRLGQSGRVLDSGLITSPDHPDGSIGAPTGAAPQTLLVGPTDGPTPAVSPLPAQIQTNRNATTPGASNQVGGTAQPAPGFQQHEPTAAPGNQNAGPETMQPDVRPQVENPPFPTRGAPATNTTGQGNNQQDGAQGTGGGNSR
jgi:hypothetical protein